MGEDKTSANENEAGNHGNPDVDALLEEASEFILRGVSITKSLKLIGRLYDALLAEHADCPVAEVEVERDVLRGRVGELSEKWTAIAGKPVFQGGHPARARRAVYLRCAGELDELLAARALPDFPPSSSSQSSFGVTG